MLGASILRYSRLQLVLWSDLCGSWTPELWQCLWLTHCALWTWLGPDLGLALKFPMVAYTYCPWGQSSPILSAGSSIARQAVWLDTHANGGWSWGTPVGSMCTVGMFLCLFGDPCLLLCTPVVTLCVQHQTFSCGRALCQT